MNERDESRLGWIKEEEEFVLKKTDGHNLESFLNDDYIKITFFSCIAICMSRSTRPLLMEMSLLPFQQPGHSVHESAYAHL